MKSEHVLTFTEELTEADIEIIYLSLHRTHRKASITKRFGELLGSIVTSKIDQKRVDETDGLEVNVDTT